MRDQMERQNGRVRSLVAAAVVVLALAGCGKDGPTVVPPTDPSTPVVAWRTVGGFVPGGVAALRPPRLVVFGDGQAVADASKTLTLSAGELADLTGTLRRALERLPPTVTAGTPVPDAPSVELSVSGRTVLFEEPGHEPAELTRLAERVRREGEPYTSERIRVVVEPRTGESSDIPWPATVPTPSNVDQIWTRDLPAEAAKALPPTGDGPWPAVRLPDGQVVGMAWRYLLPHE